MRTLNIVRELFARLAGPAAAEASRSTSDAQNRITVQPLSSNSPVRDRSRVWLPRIFLIQRARFSGFGNCSSILLRPRLRHCPPCQKSPSTKTAKCWPRNTKSGFPATSEQCRSTGNGALIRAAARRFSGFVSVERTRRIRSLRSVVDRKSVRGAFIAVGAYEILAMIDASTPTAQYLPILRSTLQKSTTSRLSLLARIGCAFGFFGAGIGPIFEDRQGFAFSFCAVFVVGFFVEVG